MLRRCARLKGVSRTISTRRRRSFKRAHRARHDDHARRLERAAGQRGTHVAHGVHEVGQRIDVVAADIKLMLDVQHAGRGHHQMRLDIVHAAQRLQHAHRIERAGGARDADDQSPHGRLRP
ncbi:hypothetical protein G6F22_019287 [Rhizopus arrhizus]|nr:hypothetical protein G6F22_019287 [Rhizopus arrhizus]